MHIEYTKRYNRCKTFYIRIVKNNTKIPIVSGFGINNVKQVQEVCEICDGAVVGSSII